MSEPWTWDDVPEFKLIIGETGEGEDREMEYRTHIVARRGRLRTAAEVVSETATDVGTATAELVATLGGTEITKTLTTGKWVCTSDHIRALEKPASFARREQTWEYYSAWAAIPASWEWDT